MPFAQSGGGRIGTADDQAAARSVVVTPIESAAAPGAVARAFQSLDVSVNFAALGVPATGAGVMVEVNTTLLLASSVASRKPAAMVEGSSGSVVRIVTSTPVRVPLPLLVAWIAI